MKALFQVGGPVPPEGYIYVSRSVDERFRELVLQDRWFHIVGARTMGKTSLVFRHMRWLAQEAKTQLAYVDLPGHVGKPETLKMWLESLGRHLAKELNMKENQALLALRKSSEVGSASLFQLLFEPILSFAPSKVLVVLDEVDSISGCEYFQEIILGLRGLHTARWSFPLLNKLIICFVGLKPIYEWGNVMAGSGSPFGDTVLLEDFPQDDPKAISEIAQGLSDEAQDPIGTVTRILHYTGGQPYLTMYLADQAVSTGIETPNGIDSLMKRFLARQKKCPDGLIDLIERFCLDAPDAWAALSNYRGLIAGKEDAWSAGAPGADLLTLSGLCRLSKDGRLEIKCRIFEEYFNDAWAQQMLSEVGTRTLQPRSRPITRSTSRIFVFNTGGTIGMVRRGDKVAPPENPEEFLKNYPRILELAQVDFEQLFCLDSVNVYPSQWEAIARAIYEKRNKGYKGFVIAHGTDTMAFTASAVAYALGRNLRFPVVFTGSQLPHDVEHGDAQSNLYRACMVALQPIPEVVICFGEYVFRAVRTQKKAEERFDGFESPNYPPLAYITEKIDYRSNLFRPLPKKPGDIELRSQFVSGVLQISLYPGLLPTLFEGTLGMRRDGDEPLCRGVILQTSGAGNVPTREPYSFLPFIEKAVRLGIPVLVSSQYPGSRPTDPRFQTASLPVQAGAIATGNMTSAAAVTKFHWVLGQVEEEVKQQGLSPKEEIEMVRQLMQQDYVGEVDLIKAT